jgi:hypothetical protein
MPSSDQTIAVISAEYTEGNPDTLKGFEVSFGGGVPNRTFPTFEEASEWAADVADHVYNSSTVDNYAEDLKRIRS